MISILCVNSKGVIADTSYKGMLWHNKKDLRFFASVSKLGLNVCTTSTFESMPPLRGRQIYQVSRSPNHSKNIYSLDQIKAIIHERNKQGAITINIGGYYLYKALIDTTHNFIVCRVNDDTNGDIKLEPQLLDSFLFQRKIITDSDYSVKLFHNQNIHPALNL